MSRYEEKLEREYYATIYAATHREKSLAVCDWCDMFWNVTSKDILVGARYNPARTICPTCGKPVRVYPYNWRNRVVAYFNTTDSLVALLSLIFVVVFYLGLLYSAFDYGFIGILIYAIFLCISAGVTIHFIRMKGELPRADDGTIDYELIKQVINKEV